MDMRPMAVVVCLCLLMPIVGVCWGVGIRRPRAATTSGPKSYQGAHQYYSHYPWTYLYSSSRTTRVFRTTTPSSRREPATFGLQAGALPTGLIRAVGSQVLMDPTLICKKTRRLRGGGHGGNSHPGGGGGGGGGGRLAEICRKEPSLLREISRGAALGTKECHYQFRNRRWNCTALRRSLRKILMKDTRETAFVHAITAAGVTYSVTRACTMGDLVECGCDKSTSRGRGGRGGKGGAMKGSPPMGASTPGVAGAMANMDDTGSWEWGGCGENVNYGYRKSREFMDVPYRRRRDIKTLVMLHNNDAGRLAVKNHMKTECKCHGLSGSCTLKTCWRKMPPFREAGDRLKEAFDGAAKVIPCNDGRAFMPEGATIKPPGRQDLVYSEESPDFCGPNRRTGSLGTVGRVCNSTSLGVEGCELLCCGRGYDTRTVKEKVNCDCRFRWCCEVTCNTCIVRRAINTCR